MTSKLVGAGVTHLTMQADTHLQFGYIAVTNPKAPAGRYVYRKHGKTNLKSPSGATCA